MPRKPSDRVTQRDDDVRNRRFMTFDPTPLNEAWVKAMCAANGTVCEFFTCEDTAEKAYATRQVFVLVCAHHHHLIMHARDRNIYDKSLREHMYGLLMRKNYVWMNAASDGFLEQLIKSRTLSETQRGIKERAARREIKQRIKQDVEASGIKAGMPDEGFTEARGPSASPGYKAEVDAFKALKVGPARIKNSGGVPSADIAEKLAIPAPREEEKPATPAVPITDDFFDVGLFG